VTKVTKDTLREYLRWTEALQRSMEMSLRSSDPTNIWKYAGYKEYARKYNGLIEEIRKGVPLPLS
jgi:hypothetical protein